MEKGKWDETYCPDHLQKAEPYSSECPGPLVSLSSPGVLPVAGGRDQLQREILKVGSLPFAFRGLIGTSHLVGAGTTTPETCWFLIEFQIEKLHLTIALAVVVLF